MKKTFIISVLFLMSCGKPLPKKDVLVKKYYEKQVRDLHHQKAKECKENVLSEVKIKLDSVIDVFINADLLDTLNFPQKPIKPNKTEHIIDKVNKFELEQ